MPPDSPSSTDGAGRVWVIRLCHCNDEPQHQTYCESCGSLNYGYTKAVVDQRELLALRERTRVLEEAISFALAALAPENHRTVGEHCGEGVCWLCAAETTLRSSLAAVAVEDHGNGEGYETRSARPVPAGEGMDGCVFCEIASGDSHDQVETWIRRSFVITPLDPVTPGHRLVIPMTHARDAAEAAHLAGEVMRDAVAYIRRAGVGDCNIITSVGPAATQTVFHLHVHIVPRRSGDGLQLPWPEPSAAGTLAAEPPLKPEGGGE